MPSFSGTVPSNALADVTLLFGSLLEFQWRSIGFPVCDFETEVRQDLVIHKFADRDGAHIEGTGRAPLMITARIPFLNGLDRGPNEHWQSPLYPYQWRRFFEACADKSTGILQHPELGPLTCKCEFARTRWEGNIRSGVYTNVTWLESDDTTDDLTAALSYPSPLASVDAFAADLDLNLASVSKAQLPQPYVPQYSFSDLANAVRGVVDTFTMMQKSFAGRLDNIVYEANALEFSLNQAQNSNALNWPLVQAAEGIKDAAYAAKKVLLGQGKAIGLYKVQNDSTLAKISAVIPAPLTDLMNLNRSLVQAPLVPQNTQVRYYLQAA